MELLRKILRFLTHLNPDDVVSEQSEHKDMILKVSYTMPDSISGKVEVSQLQAEYLKNGGLKKLITDLEFPELGLLKTLSAKDERLLGSRITQELERWATRYEKHLKALAEARTAQWVEDRNLELATQRSALDGLLAHTLDVDDTVDWETLYDKRRFRMEPSSLVSDDEDRRLLAFGKDGAPRGIETRVIGDEPTRASVQSSASLLRRLFNKKLIQHEFEAKHKQWMDTRKRAERALKDARARFEAAKAVFVDKQQETNDAVDAMRTRYEDGDAPAVTEYCDLVLQSSEYPEYLQRSWDLDYDADSRLLVIEYTLPADTDLPTIAQYRFIKSRNEVTEKAATKAEIRRRFESVIYQICIRTLHELFEADAVSAIDQIAFNGIVTRTNNATGIEETKTVMSVVASKDEFLAFDLSKVDPKATFKHLKGVSGTALIDLTPVRPLIMMNKGDRRFVDGRDVLDAVDDSVNLAAMHWEEFEHLVRELFEKEFTSAGGEVKVTQASADGGVDAIAFDPDPIRGGKIVIQAKRYTRTVGVSAVRDLMGTVTHEGANKGILVTTSNFGKDSYDFAKDKPLTLLNGQNLLYLLEKHGTRAVIDIKAARSFL